MARMVPAGLILLLMMPVSHADITPEYRVSAKPVIRPAPSYPRAELRRGNQGWVDISYVVSKDGEVLHPVVEASSGSKFFESEAISTVKRFRYEPATINGEPVQQCKTKTRISFAIEGSTDKVSRKFHSSYLRIDKLLKQQKIAEAEKRLDAVFESDGLSLGEISWLWALKARVASAKGDKTGELIAVRRALGTSKRWLPDELYAGLTKVRIVREIEIGNYAGAMEAWENIEGMSDGDKASVEPVIAQIEALISSDQLFFREGTIGENPTCESCENNWQYQPLRRSIELADVEGKLENIEIRCDWQRYVDEARVGQAWQIPESWGDRKLIVLGEPGTTFKLYEIPVS